MRKIIAFPALLLCVCFWLPGIAGAAVPLPSPPQLSAKSYVLMDFHSGRVIAEHNVDERVEPASLTKMMTAYVVSAELAQGTVSLSDEATVSEKAWRMEGSRMFIEVNKRVTVEELLKGLIIQSGNDAAVALAEHIAGSEQGFVHMMNDYAAKLGMTGTSFMNATGLPDPDHYTTARDMALLAQAVIRDYPEEYALYAEREYTYGGIRQQNRNKLLWRDDSVDGLKTGHTASAGFCLVASAVRDSMRLISVVLGTNSDKARADQSQRLLNYGFRFYETSKVFVAGQPIKKVRIWQGETEELPVGVLRDVYITVPRGAGDSLQTEIELSDYIVAPASIGQKLGKTRVKSENEVIAEADLVSLANVNEGSLFQKAKDAVLRYFE
ncbi:D-alanyl-D-alanine carboxypeptidase family protein [Granulosicoccaceae sp. 1_MG-2023]|nr:D-alanyl-D-alanine carboxypeptidase family protein [Granulosicoccaceae sp. 1_MG-2023]